MTRQLTLVQVLVASAVVAGCERPKAATTLPPQRVAVATPLARNVVDWDEYLGHFEAPQNVTLRSRVSGEITQVLFRNGQDVKAGQPLFIVDPRPFRATLDQAQAQVAFARAALANARSVEARSVELVKAQAVSREELENNNAQVRSAEANLQAALAGAENARLNLSFTTVRAPVAGRVSDKRISIGDQVAAGQTLLTTVVSLDPIWFQFDGAESFYLKYLREAKAGQRGSSRTASNPVAIQLADESAYAWRGRMEFVDNAIDAQTGTIRAHAVIGNPDHFLTPGMFGRARLLGSGTKVVPLNRSRSAIFGWSLGGLFVTHTMLSHPEAYTTFVALSPSLWRSGRAVFSEIPSFKRKIVAEGLKPRLFLAVSSREGDPGSKPIRGWTRQDWAKEIRYCRLVSNVHDLDAELGPLMRSISAPFQVKVLLGETHNSVPWAAINPILNFALAVPATGSLRVVRK